MPPRLECAPCGRALIAREVQMRQLDALRLMKWAT